ncbi:MAG: hypothetical protein LIO77_10235 [Rikenellaceae bacterium]|nr:hypothetical protein [Rikenellaceae bacterium]
MRVIAVCTLFVLGFSAARGQMPETIDVDDEIKLLRLADDVYIHRSVADMEGFGRVSSNGMVIIAGSEAVMVDTPANDRQTEILTRFIEDSLGARTTLVIPTHWHQDCIGGIDFLHRYGAESLAGSMTVEFCDSRGITAPRKTFEGHAEVEIGGRTRIICLWPGGGHTPDNIVVWLPQEKI